MAPLLTVANTVAATLHQTLFGKYLQNTLYFEYGTPFVPADMAELATALGDWITASYAAQFCDQLSFTLIEVTSLDLALPYQWIDLDFEPISGGQASAGIAVNVAARIDFITGFLGAGGKSRIFASGLPETDVTANEITVVRREALEASLADMATATFAAAWNHVVVARSFGGAVLNPVVVHDVFGYSVQARVSSMARRLDNS